MPHTRLIDICDRSGLLRDSTSSPQRLGELLSGKHDRNIEEIRSSYLKRFASTEQSRFACKSAPEPGEEEQTTSQTVPARRDADLAALYARTTPSGDYNADKAPIDIWVIHAREKIPPEHRSGRVFLLTTMDLGSPEDAEQCLRWYACAGA